MKNVIIAMKILVDRLKNSVDIGKENILCIGG